MTKRLQSLIDRTASAVSKAYHAQEALNTYCEQRYGTTPQDLDNDEIIDLVLGGCGAAVGMTAADFEDSLIRSAAAQKTQLKPFRPIK